MPPRLHVPIGQTFGMLTVIKRLENYGETLVEVKCSCGNVKTVSLRRIMKGVPRSCGCEIGAANRERSLTHGQTNHPLYGVYNAMRKRCNNPKSKQYRLYGGRGIKVCHEWESDFKAFFDWAINAGYAPGLQIDRTDNNMGYSPGNCRFVTNKQNANNTRKNKHLEYQGLRLTYSQWADRLGVSPDTISGRVKAGWPIEKVLTPAFPPSNNLGTIK